MMNDKLDWTQKLGDAFLGQQADLMDAVQRLRARARAQGTLTSTPQQTVTVDDTAAPPFIQIEPTQPEVVYVPVYNPLVVYGPWPYAAYPPYYYYPVGWPVLGAFFSFGLGIAVGAALWGGCDWHRHGVVIEHHPLQQLHAQRERRKPVGADREAGRGAAGGRRGRVAARCPAPAGRPVSDPGDPAALRPDAAAERAGTRAVPREARTGAANSCAAGAGARPGGPAARSRPEPAAERGPKPGESCGRAGRRATS